MQYCVLQAIHLKVISDDVGEINVLNITPRPKQPRAM